MDMYERWVEEREIDLSIPRGDTGQPRSTPPTEEEEKVRNEIMDLVRPYDKGISRGQVRLMSWGVTPKSYYPVFVAVLKHWEEDRWLSAPFSPYRFPASDGEFLIKKDYCGQGLNVLQLWNARTMKEESLSMGWVVSKMNKRDLDQSWEAFRYVLTGAEPSTFVIEERMGIKPILRPDDPRVEYQKEQVAIIDGIDSDPKPIGMGGK